MLALLHALNDLNPPSLHLKPKLPVAAMGEEDEEVMPCTSLPRAWGIPSKKRKDSTIEVSSAVFEKHDHARPGKKKVKLTEDFDPRPPEFKGTVQAKLPELLDKIKEEQLCISLMLDERYKHELLSSVDLPLDYNLPSSSALATTIAAFKEAIEVSNSKAREIERATREQHQSDLWFSVRRYRITASLFGHVISQRPDTPPDNLVLRIIQAKSSPQILPNMASTMRS